VKNRRRIVCKATRGFASATLIALVMLCASSSANAGYRETEGSGIGPLRYTEYTPTLPVAHSVNLHLIFWGTNFNSGAGLEAKSLVLKFANGLSGSAWQGILTQYFDATGRISPTVAVSSFTDGRFAVPPENAEVEAEVNYAIEQMGWVRNSDNIFLLMSPPGTATGTNHGEFCGYHHYNGATDLVYGFIPYPGDPPFKECISASVGGSAARAMSVAVSHEYSEAATNPHVGGPWRTPDHLEIADICIEEEGPERPAFELPSGGWAQNLFDNHINACSHGDLNPPQVYGVTEAAVPATIRTIEAKLKGTVNPEGRETTYHFIYGADQSYGGKAPNEYEFQSPDVSVGSGWKNVVVEPVVSGLRGATRYHYRIVVSNSTGTNVGKDETLITQNYQPPKTTTEGASGVASNSATVSGAFYGPGKYHFEYGTTTAYGSSLPVPDKEAAGLLNQQTQVSQAISGLQSDTTYHYRLVASNSAGTEFGQDRTFVTLPRKYSYASSFGSLGSGSLQFNGPQGIAVDQFDNVWVADQGNNRVEHFTRTGEWHAYTFGSTGSGNGQFLGPRGVACDPINHNLWVVDSGNDRVQKFNIYGEYLGQFGGSGQFVEPTGIAVTPAGNIWVADGGGNRLLEFSISGAYIREVHGVLFGGNGNGEFLHPQALAADASGNVWVADTGNHRIQELTEAGAFIRKFGSEGSGSGQFKEPSGLAFNRAGKLLVVDTGNARVQEFGPSGEYLDQFGAKGSGSGQLSGPRGIAVGRGGAAYVVDSGNNRVERWNQPGAPEAITSGGFSYSWEKPGEVTITGSVFPRGLPTTYQLEYGATTSYGGSVPMPAGSMGEGFESVTKSQTLTQLPASTKYHFRVVATNSEGTAFGGDSEFVTPAWRPVVVTGSASAITKSSATISGSVNPAGKSRNYYVEYGKTTSYGSTSSSAQVAAGWESVPVSRTLEGLAAGTTYHYRLAASGEGYGSDRTFTTSHAFETIIPAEGDAPVGVAFYSEFGFFPTIWAVDSGSGKVVKFNAAGQPTLAFGTPGAGPGQFLNPKGIAVTSAGVWVADAGNHRVQKFSLEGKYLGQFGTQGTGPGQFLEPYGVAVGPSGNIWVSDRQANRVQQFSSQGTYIREATGTQFLQPSGLTVLPSEGVYVADAGNDRLVSLGPEGNALAALGKPGTLDEPSAVTVLPSGELAVADTANDRVAILSPEGVLVDVLKGSALSELKQPQGVVAGNGRIYVAATASDWISVWK
jgi:sugar lactone lactonase YvrE